MWRSLGPAVHTHFRRSSLPSLRIRQVLEHGKRNFARSKEVIASKHKGLEVIHDPHTNRGSGFSIDEKERLNLRGLVPPRQQGIVQQSERVMATYRRQRSALDKFQFLSLLMDRNTVLFYNILVNNLQELAPIVYTPTVGEACQKFHAIYRRTYGMYFSSDDKEHFRTMVYNWPRDDVDVVVVTDGSRVLALGDLGCNSMNIPIGKLSLYIAGAGINPTRVLPVVLDVGTDNKELRENPLYLGIQKPRLTGDAYFEVLDEWMDAMRYRWPDTLIQFEDFSSDLAPKILARYRNSHAPTFNDDIQSTGCIAVAAVYSSLRARGIDMSAIGQEKIVCVGAGSAGIGVCQALVQAMVSEGTSVEDAYSRFYILDKNGLMGKSYEPRMEGEAAQFVRDDVQDGMDLLSVIKEVKPTILIGLSGVAGLFTKDVVTEMSKHNDQSVIFPMSNPSSASECTAAEAFNWTNGKVIFASGSPFKNVTLGDGSIGFSNQANNVYSFPGLGLAASALKIKTVTDEMFLVAAKRIAGLLPTEKVREGCLFPTMKDLRYVSVEVATAVGELAIQRNLNQIECEEYNEGDIDGLRKFMKSRMWEPEYDHIVSL